MAKKTAVETDTRVPAHGRGLLRTGNPGNRGGTGRPSNLARQLAAEALAEDGVKAMRALLLNKKDPHNQVNSFNALAKLLPQQVGEDPDAPFLTDAQRRDKLKALLG